MGCGSSTHPIEVGEALENNDVDPNENTKSVGRTGYKGEQEIVHAADGEKVQEKHVSSQKQSDEQDIYGTLGQKEQAKSEEKLVKNDIKEDSEYGIADATDAPSENNKDSSTGQVHQVINGEDLLTVSTCRDQRDENKMNNEDAEVQYVTAQTETRDSPPDKDDYRSRDLAKKTTQNETDFSVVQVITTPSNQSIEEIKEPSTKVTYKEETDLTNGALSTEQIAENNDLLLSENQLDADVTEPPCCNNFDKAAVMSTEENDTVLDQGQVSQTNHASVVQASDNLQDDQTNNTIDLDEDADADLVVKLKLTDENVVLAEMNPEENSNEYKNGSTDETILQQLHENTSSEAIAHSSYSTVSCVLQQENTTKNEQSAVTSPCEEAHESLQSKDSSRLSVVGEVSNTETEAQDSAPSRDIVAENRLLTALWLSCKLSPGHLVKDLDVKGVTSVHLMRSLSPGLVTVAELVQKLVHLTELDLSGNLLGPQGFRVICLAFRRNETLKCLNLANNLADTDSSDCLGMMLSTNSTLERLDVSGNNLGSDYFSRCVGPALMTNNSLKALKFSSCGSNDVSAICKAMAEGNAAIEELDASNNHVGAVFGKGLSNILEKPACCLRHLDVHGTNLANEGMVALLAGIQNNSSLVSLNAAGHQVSSLSFLMEFLYSCICHPTLEELILEGTKVLERDEWEASGVIKAKRSSDLIKLILSGCSLTDQVLKTLSEKAPGKLNQLAYLDLSSNDQLTTECLSSVCALTSLGQSNQSLSALDFSLNAADDIAADIEKLPQLKNLKSLLLKKCRISPTSIADLSKLVTMTTPDSLQITSLTLDGIKLSGTDALKSMLGLSDMFIPTKPCNFELLSLTGCGLSDRDLKALMNAMANGLVVKELRLSANRLTDTAVNYLLDSTGTSLSLEALDLSINKIRNGGAEKLAGAISDKLANLKSLLLADNCIGKVGILALVGKISPASQLGVLNLKSQQQALGEEDVDEIVEQLAKSLGFDPENSEAPTPDFILPPSNFTINLTGLGGEPGELGSRLDSLAVLTDYSSKHRRTLTLEDALQLSAVLSQTENTRAQMSQSDWNRVISADKDAPGWLQVSSQRACAIYVSNLPLSVTAEKLEGQLDNEAECNVMEVYLLKDQILRKPNGLAWVLFTDTESVQRAVEYYNSGQAFMYGTPFVISPVNVDVTADTYSEENALDKARQEMMQRAEDRKAGQTAHAQLVQSNYSESLARHEYAAQHPAYADGRVW